jgi:uncharacterized RDD family membrane protein YckC
MSFNTSLGQPIGQTVQVIGFGRRLVAYLIDVILLSVIGGCLGFGAGVVSAVLAGGRQDAGTSVTLLAQCLGVLIGAAYFVVFWATTGQTPGKMALGIKVISTDGSPVSWGKALLRYLGYIISGLVLSIGFIWAAFDAKRQGWHDKIAGTYVVPKETHFSAADAVTFVPSDSGSAAAVVVILVAIVLILVLVSIVVIAILLLLGPVVGNVFSNIIMNLETPAP